MTNLLRLFNLFGPFLISVLLVIFAAVDIVHDIANNDGYGHIVSETIIFFLGFLLNIYFVHRATVQVSALAERNQTIGQELQFSKTENESLKTEQQKFREGLCRAIEAQMKKWGLTPSEVEIAFLLIKGLSNKEIASVRETSESTVRLQCSSIYKKSNLSTVDF